MSGFFRENYTDFWLSHNEKDTIVFIFNMNCFVDFFPLPEELEDVPKQIQVLSLFHPQNGRSDRNFWVLDKKFPRGRKVEPWFFNLYI